MTDTIFLIEEPTDTNEIKKNIAKYENPKVISLNYITHRVLQENDISHKMGEDYLTYLEHKTIDEKSISATLNWWNQESIRDYPFFRGINLPSLIEMELVQYLSPLYRTAFIISKIIEVEKPVTIIAITILNEFVSKLCNKKNIQVVTIEKVKQPTLIQDRINIKYNIGSIPLSVTISRKRFITMKKLFEKIVYSIFNLYPDYNSKKKTILLLDFNPASYKNLLQELSELDKNILLLNQRRPAIWNFKSFKIIHNTRCKIIDLNKFQQKLEKNIKKMTEEMQNKLETVWRYDDVFERLFSVNGETFWYSIKNNFVKLCSARFTESIKRILLLEEFFTKFNISVILEWAETAQEEKEILYLAKKLQIKSIMLQHAMFPTSKQWDPFARFLGFLSHPVISDKQAVWGPITKDFALSHGYEEKNLFVIGSPRHDNFFKYKSSEQKGIILFAPTGASGISSENADTVTFEKFDNFVREICRVAKKFPDKKLIIKPHPSPDYINRVSDLVKQIDPSIQIIYEASLTELIDSCEILITNNYSTIALESLILNKPTISLQIEKWAEEGEIVKTGAILSISDISQVESGMKKLLYDEESKEKLLNNSKKFVESYLSNRGNASKELVKVLDNF